MATIRVFKTKNYTVMSNTHLQDPNLSLRAKGLLSIMLSLPDDWEYSIDGLAKICMESERIIKATLNELKEHGYLVIAKRLPNETKSGRIEYEYCILEVPCLGGFDGLQEVQKQGVEKQGVEKQEVEIVGQLNTNIQNTKERKDISKDISKRKKDFTPPTLEEVQDYCLKRNNGINPEQFLSHYEANGWMVGRTKMRDWKAAVRYWETNSRRSNVKPVQDIEPIYDASKNPVYTQEDYEELLRELNTQ